MNEIQEILFSYRNRIPQPMEVGPLAGKSFLLQPNMTVRGWPCEAGSIALEKYVALEDATVVEKLKNAGATLAGSTRMAELGLGLTGDTTVQAFTQEQCDVALVTDTMGEARVAASLARAYGFKPSWGIVSRFGLIGLVPSMECYGLVARTINDLSAAMSVLSCNDLRDPSMIQQRLPDFTKTSEPDGIPKLGVIRECFETLPDGESKALRASFSKLEKAGIHIEEVSYPDYELHRTVYHIIGAVEASSSAGKYDGVRYGHRANNAENWNEMYLRSRAESFSLFMKNYLFQGAYFQFQDFSSFENACRIRRRLVENTKTLFDEVDILLMPTRSANKHDEIPLSVDELYDSFAHTLFANVNGHPSLTLPGFVLHDGEDLGLQLVGALLDDVRLLAFADRLTRLNSDLQP